MGFTYTQSRRSQLVVRHACRGGYPGLALFVAIFGSSIFACRRVRKMAKRGEATASLGRYAIGMESSLVAFAVGGAFVSYHYNEMLWHFFGLSMALEHVAVTQAATVAAPVAFRRPRCRRRTRRSVARARVRLGLRSL